MSTLAMAYDPNWRDRANCLGTDTDEFYPEKGGSTAIAKRICDRCEVTAECLRYALDHNERGVWGGLSENERKALKKRRTATRMGVAA